MKIKIDTTYVAIIRIVTMISVFFMLPFSIATETKAGCPPSAQYVCDLYNPGSIATGSCTFETCFKMNRGMDWDEGLRLLAPDEGGDYTDTFFVWGEGEYTIINSYPPWVDCSLIPQGKKKVSVGIPPEGYCAFIYTSLDGTVYYEHLTSSEYFECMGWVECAYQE